MRNSLRQCFERRLCISLDGADQRWAAIRDQVESSEWPFGEIERFRAIDGGIVPAPRWFAPRNPNAVWGCLMSHVRAWEAALNEGVESLLVLEDDAVLCRGFRRRAVEFVTSVPDDWKVLWLGGELMPGTRSRHVHGPVYQPEAVWRTHAYVLRRPAIEQLYLHVLDAGRDYGLPNDGSFHLDHQLAVWQRRQKRGCYCPGVWLIGQSGAESFLSPGETQRGPQFYQHASASRRAEFTAEP